MKGKMYLWKKMYVWTGRCVYEGEDVFMHKYIFPFINTSSPSKNVRGISIGGLSSTIPWWKSGHLLRLSRICSQHIFDSLLSCRNAQLQKVQKIREFLQERTLSHITFWFFFQKISEFVYFCDENFQELVWFLKRILFLIPSKIPLIFFSLHKYIFPFINTSSPFTNTSSLHKYIFPFINTSSSSQIDLPFINTSSLS